MTAGIVSATMLLHKHGRLANEDVSANMVIARELFNVTMTIKGVLEHNRLFWTSDSFYDDRLWAVCFPSASSYIWKVILRRLFLKMSVLSCNATLCLVYSHVPPRMCEDHEYCGTSVIQICTVFNHASKVYMYLSDTEVQG